MIKLKPQKYDHIGALYGDKVWNRFGDSLEPLHDQFWDQLGQFLYNNLVSCLKL